MTVVPIFVSSTFRDFHAERDELAGPIRKVLNERFEADGIGIRVEVVDLRWGVETASLTEQERNDRVLDVCLGEIDRCRPLFVGLIGDRPGWSPAPDRLRRVAAAAGFAPPRLPKTITGLEMSYAVAAGGSNDPVFFRRVLVGRPPPGWTSDDRNEINRLVTALPSQALHAYEAPTDGERVTDLAQFRELVVSELEPRVRAIATEVTADRRDPYLAAEALAFGDLRRGFVDATGFARELAERAARGASVCVFGPSGCGKSAAWLAAVDALQEWERVVVLAAGVVPEMQDHDVVVRRLIETVGGTPPAWPEPNRRERALLGLFEAADLIERREAITGEELHHALLGALRDAGEPIVALDGIDRLNPTEGSRRLDLLAELPCRALVTTADTGQMRILRARGFQVVQPPPLDPDDVVTVSRSLATERRRALPGAAARAMAARCRSPLWVRTAIHELEELGEKEFVASERVGDADPTPLLVRTARGFPDDEHSMLVREVERAVTRFGPSPVAAIVMLCLAAPFGLRRSDLSALCEEDDLTIAGIVRQLDTVLTSGVGAARVRFRTLAARAAAGTLYGDLDKAHSAIASWLQRKPDRDAIDELALLYHRLFVAGDIHASAERLHRGSASRDAALRLTGRAIAEQRPRRTALDALVATAEREPPTGSLSVSHRVVTLGSERAVVKTFIRDVLAADDVLEDYERAELARALDDPASRMERLSTSDARQARAAIDDILTPLENAAVGTRFPAGPCEYADALTLASETLLELGAEADAQLLSTYALDAIEDFPAEPDHRYTLIQLRALRVLADHAVKHAGGSGAAPLLDRSIDLAGSALRSWPAHRRYRQGYAFRRRSRGRLDAEDLSTGEADRLYALRAAYADALTSRVALALSAGDGPRVRSLASELLEVLHAMTVSAATPTRDANARAARLSGLSDIAMDAGMTGLAARLSMAVVAGLTLLGDRASEGLITGELARQVWIARGSDDKTRERDWLKERLARRLMRGATPSHAAAILLALDDDDIGVATGALFAVAKVNVDATALALQRRAEADPSAADAAAHAMVLLRQTAAAARPGSDTFAALRDELLRCGRRSGLTSVFAADAVSDACWMTELAAMAPGADGARSHDLARTLSIKADLLEQNGLLAAASESLDLALAAAQQAAAFLSEEARRPYLLRGISAARALAERRGDSERLERLQRWPSASGDEAGNMRLESPGRRWDAEAYFAVSRCLRDNKNTVGADAALAAGLDAGFSVLAFMLGASREERQDLEGAISAYRRGADIGLAESAYALARCLGESRRPEEEKRAVERAIELGHPSGPWTRARLAENEGDEGTAEHFHRLGHAQGDSRCSSSLAQILHERGALHELLQVTREAADRQDPHSLFEYALALEDNDRSDQEIESALRAAVDQGSPAAAIRLGDRMLSARRDDDAIALFRKAQASGKADRSGRLGHMLKERGDSEAAERSWRRGLALGARDNTASYLAALLRAKGATREALETLRTGAENGSVRAAEELAEQTYGERTEQRDTGLAEGGREL